VALSYIISALVFIIVSVTGFLTFGSISDGLILNNYSTQDSLMTLSRAAVALSLVFTYPLPFVGLRDGVLALAREFWIKQDDNHNNDNTAEESSSSTTTTTSAATTTATMVKAKEEEKAKGNDNTSDDSFAVTTILSLVLLGAITLGAESISDLKLVLAVGGGTFSTAVASVFPALMFRSAMLQQHKLQDDNNDRMILAADDTSNTIVADNTSAATQQRRQWESLEIKFVTALMGLSITIGATGVYRALESAMNQ
jgi:amino acid permease